VHTAVKIDTQYSGAVIHVNDASRSVPVVQKLLSADKESFTQSIKEEYEQLRIGHKARKLQKKYISIEQARANKCVIDWGNSQPTPPSFLGNKVLENYPLEDIVPYIDWTPFFQTWELKGRYPKILDDSKKGTEAKKLFADARQLLKRVVDEKLLEARAVIGFYPANTEVDDTIIVYKDEHREEELGRFHTLRQQGAKARNVPNLSFGDFVAPKESGVKDYIGGFAVTAGIGIEKIISEFEQSYDDYNVIMIKALADRLVEAFTELMHERVRKEFWGYAPDEKLFNEELIQEKYQGIRPAPGYPGCPDHTEKITLFDLLDAEKQVNIHLTENLAMYPASSVSGLYYAHPEARYFGLGKILPDQLEDIAKRKNMAVKDLERWLSPNLEKDVPIPVA